MFGSLRLGSLRLGSLIGGNLVSPDESLHRKQGTVRPYRSQLSGLRSQMVSKMPEKRLSNSEPPLTVGLVR